MWVTKEDLIPSLDLILCLRLAFFFEIFPLKYLLFMNKYIVGKT